MRWYMYARSFNFQKHVCCSKINKGSGRFEIAGSKHTGGLAPSKNSGLEIRVRNENLFILFLYQTYVVGTPKNRLNETVLLSPHNIC